MPDYETIKLAEISVRIREVGTLENAKKYFETTDKYVFCLDLLDLSLTYDGHALCDKAVQILEEHFDHQSSQS